MGSLISIEVPVYITRALIKYTVDFKITYPDYSTRFYEAKGKETSRFKVIKQLWPFYGPSSMTIVSKVYPWTTETIEVHTVSP